jgi:hypothetical protein
MNTRRIALGLGTGAGALLGAALLSGLASPLAVADESSTDVFAIDPVSGTLVTDPTLTAFGGLGTDVVTTEEFANFDTGTATTPLATPELADVSGATTQATGGAGTEELLTNTYSNPLFTDISTDVTSATTTGVPVAGDVGSDATGSLAGNVGFETDTIYLDPSALGDEFGISLESVPGVDGAAPTVTEDLITPLGNIPLGDGLTSMLGGSDLSSLLGSGDVLTALDPVLQLLTAF